MNIQQSMSDDFMIVGSDTSHLGYKASASLSSLMSIHMTRLERRDIYPSAIESHEFGSKSPLSKAERNSGFGSPKEVRPYSRATNDSPESRYGPPYDIPSSFKLSTSILPASPTSASKNLSYEQETWRLYNRIQTARKDIASLPPMDDMLKDSVHEAADDWGCYSNHTCRTEEDVDQQPIIFDLEL
jgi:hypothetical protein